MTRKPPGRLPPEKVQARLDEGRECERRGDLAGAARAYEQVLATIGEHADIQHALALVYARGGEHARAETLLRRACELAPGNAALLNNLGNVLNTAGQQRAALEAYQGALAVAPEHVNAHYNVGRLMEQAGRREEALVHAREVVRQAPGDVSALNWLGVMLAQQGDADSARQAFEKALVVQPDSAQALVNLGGLYMSSGDTEAASAMFRRVLEVDPGYLDVYGNIARTRRFKHEDLPFIEEVAGCLQRPGIDVTARIALHFAVAKMLDDCGDYDRAFGHFREGNDLRRGTQKRFDHERLAHDVDASMQIFDRRWLEKRIGGGADSAVPVFICGMMRSGTTLVEQMLSSHPLVFGAGELDAFPSIASRLKAPGSRAAYPQCALHLEKRDLQAVGAAYLARLPAHPAEILRVTDKQVYNFLYLGLLAVVLPRAALVYCERDPADVCLSIYFQNFVDGHAYAYDQGDIAFYYREHERLMAHWFDVLGERVLRMRYEQVVAGPEQAARSLVAHAGLDWDERCLNPADNQRTVLTASNWQVRQPVYKTSMERWRRYEKHLGPMLEALQA